MAVRNSKAKGIKERPAAARKPSGPKNGRPFNAFRPRPKAAAEPAVAAAPVETVPPEAALSVPRVEAPSASESAERARTPYDGDSAIKLYLREIGQVPLLTIQQEIELAARIHKGDKAARELMIKANLRLVVKIAHDYDWLGMPLLDLINEGNIGLMKAVERFDPAKGGKLSTYAAWWIKQSIRRALTNQSKTIRLPVHAMERLWEIRKVSLRFEAELGREPTNAELAAELGTTVRRIAAIREANLRPASLDAPLGTDSDSSRLGEIIEDEHATTPYEDLEKQTLRETMTELLHKLPEREVVILKQRFGLEDSDRKTTLAQIGRRFGVTRERIRQLQNLALQKLRTMMAQREALPEAA